MKYIIYKIEIEDYIYIGSTKNFTERKYTHKSACNNKQNKLVYNKINELGGWEIAVISPIEEIECETKIQALIREEFHRKDLKANLNMMACHRTNEERLENNKQYYETHKNHLLEQMKEYRIENRDHILEVKKQHYYANKEADNLKCKEYRNSHVEEIKLRQSNYHKENIEKIHLKNNEVKLCECGKSYTHANKARHIKSQFHISTLIL
jgi:hypothetical protein